MEVYFIPNFLVDVAPPRLETVIAPMNVPVVRTITPPPENGQRYKAANTSQSLPGPSNYRKRTATNSMGSMKPMKKHLPFSS